MGVGSSRSAKGVVSTLAVALSVSSGLCFDPSPARAGNSFGNFFGGVVGGVVGAGAVVDLLQLLPVIILVAVAGGAGLEQWAGLLLAVMAGLLTGSLLGCAVACLAGGVGEVLLDVCVLLAPLLFLGGLFTGVPRLGWGWTVATIDPFGQLGSAFIGALGGSPAFSPATVLLVSAAAILVVLAAVGLLSRPLLERR